MASDDPDERYRNARSQLERDRDDGAIAAEDYGRIDVFLAAKNPETSAIPAPESGTVSLRTLESYCLRLRLVAAEVGLEAIDDVDEVNQLLDGLQEGETDVGPADGYAIGTMQQFAGALSGFFEVHDLGIDSDRIASVGGSDPAIDSRTVLDRADVRAMRDAATNSRDSAVLDLLALTMQRVRAIQTLRIRDVDLEDMALGTFYLNEDSGGLKGASGKRSLLGAKGAVRRWLSDHPRSDEPDARLITSLPSAARGEPGAQLSHNQIVRIVRKLADEAGVEKPSNPHAFRHYGVTIARRVYDMSWDEIANQGGWTSSETPKRIYEHLADEDHIKKIEIQYGEREPEDGIDPTDTICPACDAILEPGARACPECGAAIRPDAKSVDDRVRGEYREADDLDALEKIQRIDELLDDPDVRELIDDGSSHMGD